MPRKRQTHATSRSGHPAAGTGEPDRPRRARAERAGGDARSLRALNLDEILRVVMQRQEAFTRAELVAATGLSSPTVGSLLAELTQRGLVRDLGPGPSSGGRRPSFMEFDTRYGFVAGIDLGPATTRLAVADLSGERSALRVLPTAEGLRPRELLERTARALQGLVREAHVPPGRLLAVGAAAPGAVDQQKDVVTLAPNLPGWSRVPMRRVLQDALETPVVVENDVNLAVLGERWKGAARGHDTCVFINLDAGIGAGVVVNGALHRGHHSLAGEIGLMCMGPQYLQQDFGNRGCLETLAGQSALAARWSGARGQAPEHWLPDLFQAAERGRREARQAVLETARLVGIATANLSLVLDPSLIVLGGSLAMYGPSLVREVRRIVEGRLPTPAKVVVSALGEEAPLWGSLLVADREARERLHLTLRAT
jgi:glucokinase